MPYSREALYITSLPADAQSDDPQQKMSKLDDDGRGFEMINGDTLKYYSEGGEGSNFNCQLRDVHQNEIACRHLTRFLMTQPRAIKDYHEKLGSLGSMAKITSLTQGEFDKAKYTKFSTYDMLPPERMGHSLAEIAELLKPNEEARLVCLSDCHMMGITVARKKMYTGKEQFVVKFYDPNTTDAHMRFICPSLESLSRLTTEDLQDDPKNMQEYWKRVKTVGLFSPHNRDGVKDIMVREGVPHEDVLFYAMSNNISDHAATASKYICAEGAKPDMHKLSLALGFGLRQNSRESLQAYTDEVLKSGKTSTEKKDLLLAIGHDEDDEKSSDLIRAIKEQKFEVVQDYVTNVLSSNLEPAHKVELINCGKATTNILFSCTHKDREPMLRFTVDAVLSSDLPPRHKVDILRAHNPVRGSALFMKMSAGDDRYVSLITDKILASNLDPDSKIESLLARDKDGQPIGFIRLIHNRHEALADTFLSKLDENGLLEQYQSVLTEQLESPLKEEAIEIIEKYRQDVAQVASPDDIEHDEVATSSPPSCD